MIDYTGIPELDKDIDRQIRYLNLWQSIVFTKSQFINLGKGLARHMLIVEERLAPKQLMDIYTIHDNMHELLVCDRNSKADRLYLIQRKHLKDIELYD